MPGAMFTVIAAHALVLLPDGAALGVLLDLEGLPAWLAFGVSAYVLGHIIFSVRVPARRTRRWRPTSSTGRWNATVRDASTRPRSSTQGSLARPGARERGVLAGGHRPGLHDQHGLVLDGRARGHARQSNGHRARGVCISTNRGLPELIATTAQEYVRIAVGLSHDLPRLGALRAGLRARMEASPLMNRARFAKNLERQYRRVWLEWCAREVSPAAS
jgi:hypothetical protein